MGIDQKEELYRLIEDRGGVLGQWYPYTSAPSTGWDPYDKRVIATQASGAAVTLSTSIGSDPSAGPPTGTMNITASAGGSDNHREWFLRSDRNYEYSQITSIWYGGGTWADADNRTQQGHVHRYQKLENGHIRAYVVWHDVFLGSPTAINIGIWETDGTGTGTLNLHSVNNFLPLSVQPSIPITICSRASNLITCWTTGAHYLRTGDLVNLTVRDATLANLRISNVAFTNLLQIPHTAADDTDMGPGLISKVSPLDKFPYVVSSRLLPGDVFQAKIWRLWEPEPPWSAGITYATPNVVTPAGSVTGPPPNDWWPTGKGLCGVYAGHMHTSELVRFGLPDIRELSG